VQNLKLRLVTVGGSHEVTRSRITVKVPSVTSGRGLASGRCHICRSLAPVEHLLAIGHWVCVECQVRFMNRGAKFMKAMCEGESLDCCGPIARLG